MKSSLRIEVLLGALALGFASASFAAQPLPINPMLIDAMRPALPRVEELSLPELADRLRDTKAIPPARKAELMSEFDGLLDQFRLAYRTGNPQMSSLREPYDRLLGKIQASARKDRQLSRDIAASRVPIWESLSDRSTFASLE